MPRSWSWPRSVRPAAIAAACIVMAGCSSTLQVPDAGAPSVDGRALPGDGGPSFRDAGTTACFADSDCVVTNFIHPLSSAADCYCIACPSLALNHAAAAAHVEQWARFCTDWPGRASCPLYDCATPPPVRCVARRCVLGSWEAPATCPQDPASGCPANAVRCGDVCCGAAEWCDQTIGACRCGFGNGCNQSTRCATTAPAPDQCGGYCCGAGTVDCPQ